MTVSAPILVPVVAGVVLSRDGKYLLVQENKSSVRGLWNLPAGRVEEGHTIEQTAVREASEESGFNVTLMGKLGIWQESERNPVAHIFRAEIIGGELKSPTDEISDARWFTLDEVRNMKTQLRAPMVLEAVERSVGTS